MPLGGMTTFCKFVLNPVLLSNAEISPTATREQPITTTLLSCAVIPGTVDRLQVKDRCKITRSDEVMVSIARSPAD